MKTKLALLLLICMMAVSTYAQTATSPRRPAEPARAPAAEGRRSQTIEGMAWRDGEPKETRAQKEFRLKPAQLKDLKVVLNLTGGQIKIEGYDGNEVIVQGPASREVPQRAEGLKPLYSGTDNTGIGLSVTQNNNIVEISKATRGNDNYLIRVPRKVSIYYQEAGWGGNEVNIENIDGELELKTNNSSMNLRNVGGPVIANSTNGSVTVVFASLNQQKPSAISVVNGEVDITMPANTKSEVKFKSMNGEIYTDFDLALREDKDRLRRVGGGHLIEASTNGGGVEVKVNSINSNIYFRKGK
jgi:hypothetical protein